MITLQQIAITNPQWSLEELVQATNQLLPQFLPSTPDSDRAPPLLNPRLVRHYTTQGLIDKPLRQGREARYTYRHLLQLLVVRRLLAEGVSGNAIQTLIADKTNADLESLLQGGVQLTVAAANPALAFLQRVKQRSNPLRSQPLRSNPPSAPPASPPLAIPINQLVSEPSATSPDQSSAPSLTERSPAYPESYPGSIPESHPESIPESHPESITAPISKSIPESSEWQSSRSPSAIPSTYTVPDSNRPNFNSPDSNRPDSVEPPPGSLPPVVRSAPSMRAISPPNLPVSGLNSVSAPPSSPAVPWLHLEILPGLELHIRQDFRYPASPQEQANLLQLIAHHLTNLFHRRSSP